ncbi:MAG: tRNA threonylcarbamoyladenosine dehydratase [Deltaproteobacteria bacterium]|nr:tRNA threonylcarbamoyladenosine dehydratase [Deltaproteobacteria bacterium]
MFGRTIDLLGAAGFERLQKAAVAVFGLGGVGSHAAVALARAGVGRLRLVDFDPVTWSSLNRNAFALPGDVGAPKVEVARRHLQALNPDLVVETHPSFFHRDSADLLLAGSLDCVVDAIDGLSPKVALLELCCRRGLPVVSSMGASSRVDPAQVRIGDIDDTSVCPLARRVRKALRRLGIRSGIPVVYSTEPPRPPLPPDEDEPALLRGRPRRRQPSLSTLPGIFGYALASIAIARLAGLDLAAAPRAAQPR